MRWKANPDVVMQRLGDSMVLVNLATDRILELNDTAATLFELISSGLDETEVESRMVEIFDVDPIVVRSEMPSVLASLAEQQVLSAHA
ncbi:MAG: PqqD family protein [Trueperaceae bacterium]